MAKGRMIDKVVILSKKVNKVSEGAENLYYRIYINTDDYGHYHADPQIIKGQIYTLRKISIPIIKKRLAELTDAVLIKLYEVNEEQYLEIIDFEKHQKFRKDIARKAEYPFPNPIPKRDVTDTEQDETKRSTKSSQDKSSQDKSLSKDKQPSAAQSSKHFSDKIQTVYLEPLLDIAKKIQGKSNGKKAFNFYQWIQIQIRKQAHPAAMLKAGNGLLDYWDTVNNPRGYLDGIMKVENANANESDWVQEHKKIEAEFDAWMHTPDAQKITKLLNLKNMET